MTISRRGLLSGALGLGASALILPPERKFWQLDQTMLSPKIYTGNFQESVFKGWRVSYYGPEYHAGLWEEWSLVHLQSGHGFTLKADTIMQNNPRFKAMVREDILKGMRRIEYLIESLGRATRVDPTLPGEAQSIAYNQPLPDLSIVKPEWPEWWR